MKNPDVKKCPKCGEILELVYENVGFEAPDPTKEEFIGFECKACGHKE